MFIALSNSDTSLPCGEAMSGFALCLDQIFERQILKKNKNPLSICCSCTVNIVTILNFYTCSMSYHSN